jgi:hypothetical protein
MEHLYTLVPIEPTEAMLKAAEREWDGRMSARSAGVWKAMLDAAPTSIVIATANPEAVRLEVDAVFTQRKP